MSKMPSGKNKLNDYHSFPEFCIYIDTITSTGQKKKKKTYESPDSNFI